MNGVMRSVSGGAAEFLRNRVLRGMVATFVLLPLVVGCHQSSKKSKPAASSAPPVVSHPPSVSSLALPNDEPMEPEPEDAGNNRDAPLHVGIPADSSGRLILPDASTKPPAPVDIPLDAPLPTDDLDGRELSGVTLTASWIWKAVPGAANVPEAATSVIDKTRKKMRHQWNIEIAEQGRLRIVFASPSFTINQNAELRARRSIFGHILVWPDATAYRPLPPGSLRPLLDERRADVTPLVRGKLTKGVAHGSRFGFPTSTSMIRTPWGSLRLEQMRTPNVGQGGQLLCRTLVEIVGAKPSNPICRPNHLPLHASYRWQGGHEVVFHVDSFVIRTDFPPSTFFTPPRNAAFRTSGLPPEGSGIFLSRKQLAAFRTKASKNPEPRKDPEAHGAPGEGFILQNYTNAMMFFVLDGVPVAWVRPHRHKYVIGPLDGTYRVQWRSFLGWTIHPPKDIRMPARITIGEAPDAGAPKPAKPSP